MKRTCWICVQSGVHKSCSSEYMLPTADKRLDLLHTLYQSSLAHVLDNLMLSSFSVLATRMILHVRDIAAQNQTALEINTLSVSTSRPLGTRNVV